MNKFCNFCAFFSYFGVKNRHFSTNFKSNFDAQNAGNGTCGLQKFSGGACPQTPLGRAWPSAPYVDFIQNATVRLRR
jgi:hypothetical protein